MTLQEPRAQRLMLELQARDAWNHRDYQGAQSLAEALAASAVASNDAADYWNATFLVAECLRKQGEMGKSQLLADELAQHPLTQESDALRARVLTLAAFALQGSGDLRLAALSARSALEAAAAAEPNQVAIRIEAQNALIAALAESGKLEEAWIECLVLAELLSTEPGSQTNGLGYWAIGNVAFLLKHITEGVAYHQLAAKNLSPTNDLDLWARFNRASASLRLTAGVVEPETLECIERAELASSIVGGTERDRLELSLTRGQWLVLTGQFDAAIDQLRGVLDLKHLLASHTAAEAHLFLGQALSGRSRNEEAVSSLEASEGLFLQSGAEDRASSARALIESIKR
ncbi:tetratricopeptide (TPR) repeat protein [Arthrobacter sp. CAN_A2]|uniref:hypothetical protein n=1 Tax=Arthrobacter sp. CAN_A2 TaxID=2787718 RepID=UPI0018F0034E